MRRAALIALATVALAGPSAAARSGDPVVVELFTAQGCASCIEANAYVAERLAEREDVVALTWSVDYWDYLGWRDTFAKPEFTKRQQAYVDRMRLRQIYTPQVIVDGSDQAAGTEEEKVEALVRENDDPAWRSPDMLIGKGGRRLWVGSGRAPRGGGEVWLIRYDPRPQQVEVRRGENKGKTVPAANVVRELVRLGSWRGRPVMFLLPKAPEGLETVVVLQGKDGGPILAAAQE